MNLHIGDRVVCTIDGGGDAWATLPKAGMRGEVVEIGTDKTLSHGVLFDEKFSGGHNLCRNYPDGRCWWCKETALALDDTSQVSDLEINLDLQEVL